MPKIQSNGAEMKNALDRLISMAEERSSELGLFQLQKLKCEEKEG